MSSSAVLVNAASGLQKFMSSDKNGMIKESITAQVSAAIFYQAQVISKLETNKAFKSKFTKVLFDQIQKDFGEYLDSQARSKPKSLHHVYEWKKTGDQNARLFKLRKIDTDDLSFKLTYDFLPSKSIVPSENNRRRHTFAMKASVMEAGMPLTIRPRASERLVFNWMGETVFLPKGRSVTVRRPGGGKVTSQFKINYSRFFAGQLVNSSIKRSGFQSIFNSSIAKALALPYDVKRVKYSFSPNSLSTQAEAAVNKAFGGML